MNLPQIITSLVTAQNIFDTESFVNCFTEDAVVADEGHTYSGRTEIKAWIEQANKKYQTKLHPVKFEGNLQGGIFATQVSGNFVGSPITLHYHIRFRAGLIEALTIKG